MKKRMKKVNGKFDYESFPDKAANVGCGILILAIFIGASFTILHDCFGMGK